jgi:hypothetical protein
MFFSPMRSTRNMGMYSPHKNEETEMLISLVVALAISIVSVRTELDGSK